MSRFAMVTEDPSYMYDEDGFCVDEDQDWEDIDTEPLGTIVDGWIRETVAQKPQEPYSPYVTVNS